jgi:DNA replication and repair protein RecF
VEVFTPLLDQAHQAIVGAAEMVEVSYRSQLAEAELEHWLVQQRDKDRILERTTAGIHRDDLVFQLAEQPLKRLGSQGQVKSFVLALKLAQYAYLRAEKGQLPILLLDDIFDKLDPQRVEQLLSFILAEDFGQVFISDTDPARIRALLSQFAADHRLYHIVNGIANPHE